MPPCFNKSETVMYIHLMFMYINIHFYPKNVKDDFRPWNDSCQSEMIYFWIWQNASCWSLSSNQGDMNLRLVLSLVIPCSCWFISSPRCGPSPILPEGFVLIRIQPSLVPMEPYFHLWPRILLKAVLALRPPPCLFFSLKIFSFEDSLVRWQKCLSVIKEE